MSRGERAGEVRGLQEADGIIMSRGEMGSSCPEVRGLQEADGIIMSRGERAGPYGYVSICACTCTRACASGCVGTVVRLILMACVCPCSRWRVEGVEWAEGGREDMRAHVLTIACLCEHA